MLDIESIRSNFISHGRLWKEATDITSLLYKKLENDSDAGITALYTDWKIHFEMLYGDSNTNLSSNKKINPIGIIRHFNLHTTAVDMYKTIFCAASYYSLLIRWIAYVVLSNKYGNSAKHLHYSEYSNIVVNIFDGTAYEKYGVRNFCYNDWYSWFISSCDEHITNALYSHCTSIMSYATQSEKSNYSSSVNDYFKEIYQCLIPKELRHAMGEFYTPDWLADYVTKTTIDFANKNGHEQVRVLDPTCGSGTFLVRAIGAIEERESNKNISDRLGIILNSVVGFDLNPLAVLTAKINYLLAIIHLLGNANVIKIPVYVTDSINVPYVDGNKLVINFHDYYLELEKETALQTIETILRDVRDNYSAAPSDTTAYLAGYKAKLYTRAMSLFDDNIELYDKTILLLILYACRDAVEANSLPKFDIVIGNPPWVNWEYLPVKYKSKSQHLWVDYGLFDIKGRALSFSKEDISVIITYSVIHNFLNNHGILGFVIRQAIFKSSQNGIGFRRFNIKNTGENIKVLLVDDLSGIKAFEGATVNAATLFLQKNKLNEYPVKYRQWRINKHIQLRATNQRYCDVSEAIDIIDGYAEPADKSDISSVWTNYSSDRIMPFASVLGCNVYRARTGVFTGGANSVYWVEVKGVNPDGSIKISNYVERAKRKAEKVIWDIEPDLIYPLCRGTNLTQWNANYDMYIICPHTENSKMKPINEKVMGEKYPRTFEYLMYFKELLTSRQGLAGWEKSNYDHGFYAIGRIGNYSFSKYKVAWKYISTKFICAVIENSHDNFLGTKTIMPNDKLMYISTDDENEAYYLCGTLSSNIFKSCVESYMNATSISTHVLNKLNIQKYDPSNHLHSLIATSCKLGHRQSEISANIVKIDQAIALLYP